MQRFQFLLTQLRQSSGAVFAVTAVGAVIKRLCSLRLLLVLTLAMTVALGCYCVHLNTIVAAKFEGQRFTIPTRIFARPLELYPGKKWTKAHLLRELDKLNYQSVATVANMGEYADHGAYLELYSRNFEFWEGVQLAQWVRLTFANGFVSTLQNHQSGQDLNYFRLEPLALVASGGGDHEDRKLVHFENIPTAIVNALIATEDQRFYQHMGIDFRSLLRALVTTVTGQGVQGGSTITQQLVKNFYLTPERTLKRKFNEMLMAIILDWRYAKNEILETYLNEVYFGQDGSRSIHGIELASQFYFGRSLDQLELHQCATLVAMLKGPSFYNPRRHPERAQQRRNIVLAEMLAQNFITPQQAEEAKAQALLTVSGATVSSAEYPAFLDKVFREVETQFTDADAQQNGLRIFTSLDPIIQEIADATIKQQLQVLESQQQLPNDHLQTAAVIAEPHTGYIAALVGGRDSQLEGFNRALDARRQVGSLIKPVVYLAALEHPDRYSLTSQLDDSELSLAQPGQAVWRPQNYDRRHRGTVPLWQALAHSYNIPTVRLGLEVGLPQVISQAAALGADSVMAPYASTLLGAQEMTPIEIAQIYAAIAAEGYRVPLRSVVAVVTAEQQVLQPISGQIGYGASPQSSYVVTSALQIAVAEGTGKSLRRYLPEALHIAGKTGTTDELRDSWFAGFNGDWLGVVWVGNDANLPVKLTGASGALTLWGAIFQQVGLRAYEPVRPKGVSEFYVHRLSGRRISSRCDHGITLAFIAGSEPKKQFGCGGGRGDDTGDSSWFGRLFGG